MPTWPAKTNYATGDVLTAAQMQDIGNALNSVGSAQYAAGKNRIINGDFAINQRAFSTSTTSGVYNFDRFEHSLSGGTVTFSAQTFTLGTAPVAGYEAKNFLRFVTSGQVGTSDFAGFSQRMESVRTFAGQTITISFWAKAASGTPSIAPVLQQYFGTGGSPSATVQTNDTAIPITTSWARYSQTFIVPSISGKTIGTDNNDYLRLSLWGSLGSALTSFPAIGLQNNTFDFWGIQVEAGSVATPFQTATGTLQGELAACQRYYQVIGGTASGFPLVAGYTSTTGAQIRWPIYFCSQMRTAPTITKNGTWNVGNAGQPSAVFIDKTGFSIQIEGLAAGNAYAYPDGTDDTFTISAEL